MPFSNIYAAIQWALILFLLLVDIVWINFSSVTFIYDKQETFVLALSLTALYLPYLFYKYYRPNPLIMRILLATFFFYTFCYVAFIFTYLCFTTHFPNITEDLVRWDSYFGFQAPELFNWFMAHKYWDKVFTFIYNSYPIQFLFLILYFGFFVKTYDIQRFVLLFSISLLLTDFVATVLPSDPSYAWYHFPLQPFEKDTLASLIELSNNIVNITKTNGIITFPSFHTTGALITIYIFRNQSKIIFIPLLLINSLMIFSCLAQGGHFLVDLFAGAILFAISAIIEKRIFALVSRYELQDERKVKKKPSRIQASVVVD